MRSDEQTPVTPDDGEPCTPERIDHWRAERSRGVLWLLLNQRDDAGAPSSVNTLSRDVLRELGTLLGNVAEQQPRALVIRSVKPSGFSVGADIRELGEADDPENVRKQLNEAAATIERLASLELPTIAVIHGHCLGGGLELALACRYRIARHDASFGFPEVRLGLHPGMGGTFRLPHIIAPNQALTMLLTGRSTDAARALKIGLVDELTRERHMLAAVEAAVVGRLEPNGHGTRERVMNMPPARQFIAHQARRKLESRTRREHYPAPFELLDLWQEHGADADEMASAEKTSFVELLSGGTARNLIRMYFLRERLRNGGNGRDSRIGTVHVVGAGTMGGDIAAWCAHQGLAVSVEDRSAELIGPTMRRAAELFARKLTDDRSRRRAWDRLMPDPDGCGRRRADLIIEAVPEQVELKQQVLGELDAQMRDDAILVTNTSSIVLQKLTGAVSRPERLAGLHFFNPVARMQLVEVVRHDDAGKDVLERLEGFVTDIDRLPVPVASSPGFLVNRVLTPYLLEAITLVDEGVPKETVDAAAESFGMPMGPIELADAIGLDICVDVAESLASELNEEMPPLPDWLRTLVTDGDLGRKTDKGLYEYQDGDALKNGIDEQTDDALVDRLMLPLIRSAVVSLAEGVVADADLLDGAIVFGTGFAPFRGGPIHFVRERGIEETGRALEALAGQHGSRFRPPARWSEVLTPR